MSDILTVPIVVRGETAAEAQAAAREWARAEPNVTLRTICSVRPCVHNGQPRPGSWTVTLALVPVVPDLGL